MTFSASASSLNKSSTLSERPTVHLSPAALLDAPEIARVCLLSFADSSHLPIVSPQYNGLSKEELLRVGIPFESRRLRQRFVGPNISLKATVSIRNEQNEIVDIIVGYACWSSPDGRRRRTLWEWFLSTIVYPIYNFLKPIRTPPDLPSLMEMLAEQRQDIFGAGGKWEGQKSWYLDLVCVDPDWQGLGVGSALLHWGLEKARQSDTVIYLESSPSGFPVYKAKGFNVVVNKPRTICGIHVELPGMIWEPRLNLMK